MVHNTIESERSLRTGCEEEYFIRGYNNFFYLKKKNYIKKKNRKSGPFEEEK